ncbi:hypothetical protein L209DRAFT_515005 [Thermothelomyces heterothallicus CBS 203.75]
MLARSEAICWRLSVTLPEAISTLRQLTRNALSQRLVTKNIIQPRTARSTAKRICGHAQSKDRVTGRETSTVLRFSRPKNDGSHD